MKEKLFMVWDIKNKRWCGVWSLKDGGSTTMEEIGKEFGLMNMDMEGFHVDDNGELYVTDECGGMAFLPSDRYELCINKDFLKKMIDSPRGNYLILPKENKKDS